MADSSRNPEDNVNLRLAAELKKLRAAASEELSALEAAQAKQSELNRSAATRETAAQRRRAPAARSSDPITPATEADAAATERTAKAAKEARDATRQRAAAEKEATGSAKRTADEYARISRGAVATERLAQQQAAHADRFAQASARIQTAGRDQAIAAVAGARGVPVVAPTTGVLGAAERVQAVAQAEAAARLAAAQAANRTGNFTVGAGAAGGGAAGVLAHITALERQAEAATQEAEAAARQAAGARTPPRGSLSDLVAGGGKTLPPVVEQVAEDPAQAAKDKAHREQLDLIRTSARNAAASEAQFADALSYSATQAHTASLAYRQHGALTTEFIEAARKGQVTLSELGYQVGATIGKFAGWTAAATAVYAVTGALAQVGKGAIDAESGVKLVERVLGTSKVNADDLRASFRDLSKEFNLPISDVADAVYGSAKAFNDQASAVDAAKASLFAMKVGELDAAQSQNTLTAVVRGFGLSASELLPVMDAVNNAQNKLGGNTGQLIQGVAKAAGQFKSAGGDYRELISIIATASSLTGASAVDVGTAVGRSASVLATPAGQKRARAAGLDPTLDPLSILQQAQRLYQQTPTRDRAQELARALVPAGGQFTRFYVPLIENVDRLNKALDVTTEKASKNSAFNELKTALQAPSEQIKALVNGMQRLGASLADAGLLDPFIALVFGLKTGIDLLTTMVDLVNKLGSAFGLPVTQVAAVAVELAGVVALMRRFNVGSHLPESGVATFLSRDPTKLYDAETRAGAEGVSKQIAVDRDRAASQVLQSQYTAEAARQQAAKFADLPADASPQLAREAARAQQRLIAAEEALERAEIKLTTTTEAAVIRRQQLSDYEALRKQNIDPQIAAERSGIRYKPSTLDLPNLDEPVPITGGLTAAERSAQKRTTTEVIQTAALAQRASAEAEAAGESALAAAQAAHAKQMEDAASSVRRAPFEAAAASLGGGQAAGYVPKATAAGRAAESVAAAAAARQAAAETTRLQSAVATARGAARSAAGSITQFGVSARALVAGAGLFGGATGQASRGIAVAAGAMRGMAVGLVAALGPLDILIAGALATAHFVSQANERQKALMSALAPTGNAAADLAAARAQAQKGPSDLDLLQSVYAQGVNNIPVVGRSLATDPVAVQTAQTTSAQNEALGLTKAQSKGVLLTVPMIQERLKTNLASAKDDGDRTKAYQAAIDEINKGYGKTFDSQGNSDQAKATRQKIRDFTADQREKIAALATTGDDLDRALAAIGDAQGFADFNTQRASLAVLRGPRASDPVAYGKELIRIRNLHAGGELTDDAAAKAIQDAEKQGIGDLQTQLDQRLTGATGQSDIAAAHKAFVDGARKLYDEPKKALAKAIDERAKVRDELAKAAVLDPSLRGPQREGDSRAGNGALEAQQARVRQLTEQDKELTARIHEYSQQQDYNAKAFRALSVKDRQAVFQGQQQSFQSQTALLQSQTADPLKQAQILVERTQRNVASVTAAYKRSAASYDDVRAATAAANAALQALATSTVAQGDLAREVATSAAQAGGQTTQEQDLRQAVSDAQGHAKDVAGQGKNLDPAELQRAAVGINQARKALNDFLRQQAIDLRNARFEYAKAGTTDPQKQLQIDVEAAKAAVGDARTPVEKVQAATQLKQAQQAALAGQLQKRYDTIDFELTMGQIEKDEAISRLQALAKAKGISTAFKRQVLERVKALQDESDSGNFDLNLNNLKLPTVYEVRRAISAGVRGAVAAQTTVHEGSTIDRSSTTVQINVNGPQDYERLGTELEKHIKGAGKALARSGGTR